MLIFALIVAFASAQSHHDPFAGSGCDCARFCAGSCSINATKPANLTLFRMTMAGVNEFGNKDTGDVPGDTSFVISRRLNAYECKQDPRKCTTLAQFSGDDDNSTDRVIQATIEVDGQWGPYLLCNPKNTSHPQGGADAWDCATSLKPTPYPGEKYSCYNGQCYPSSHGTQTDQDCKSTCKPPTPAPTPAMDQECRAIGYSFDDAGAEWCITDSNGKYPKQVVNDVSMGECCSAANASHPKYQSSWTYYPANRTCEIFEENGDWNKCDGGLSAWFDHAPGPAPTPACDCPRVHKSVGKEDPVSLYGTRQYPVHGLWYSHPSDGECTGSHYVGDGSGCTWRLVEKKKVIMAACMYRQIDDVVENLNKPCFAPCPRVPNGHFNRTTTCYLKCYSETTSSPSLDTSVLTNAWTGAFSGACPPAGTPTPPPAPVPVPPTPPPVPTPPPTPGTEKYTCYNHKCYPYSHGTETQSECEQKCK